MWAPSATGSGLSSWRPACRVRQAGRASTAHRGEEFVLKGRTSPARTTPWTRPTSRPRRSRPSARLRCGTSISRPSTSRCPATCSTSPPSRGPTRPASATPRVPDQRGAGRPAAVRRAPLRPTQPRAQFRGFSVGGPRLHSPTAPRTLQRGLLHQRRGLPQPDELSGRPSHLPPRPIGTATQRGADRACAGGRTRSAGRSWRTRFTTRAPHARSTDRSSAIPSPTTSFRELCRSGGARNPVAHSRAGQWRAAEQLRPGHPEPQESVDPDRQSARHWDQNKLSGYWVGAVRRSDHRAGRVSLPHRVPAQWREIYGYTLRVNVDKTLKPTLQLHAGVGYAVSTTRTAPLTTCSTSITTRWAGWIVGSATDPAGFPVMGGPWRQRRRLQQLFDGTWQREQVLQQQTDGRGEPRLCSQSAHVQVRR